YTHALHCWVRLRGAQHRGPFHQTLAAIDEAFFVQTHELLGHATRQFRIHGEGIARPADRVAATTHLARDGAACLFLPGPHALEEFLAPQVEAARTFRLELPLHDHL